MVRRNWQKYIGIQLIIRENMYFILFFEGFLYLIIKFSKYYWSGGTPTPFNEKFHCKFGRIRTCKKIAYMAYKSRLNIKLKFIE